MRLFRLHSVPWAQSLPMRVVLLFLAWWSILGVAHAQGAAVLRNCLAPGEMREVISTQALMPPANAVMLVQRQMPQADVVRANLCRTDNTLVYVIMALSKDGRLIQVMIDAPTGRIRSMH